MEMPKKRTRIDPVICELHAPGQLAYNPENKFFELSKLHLKDSGLDIASESLFCREQFHQLFSFLENALYTPRLVSAGGKQNPYTVGWILGSPGIGKSNTVLAFAWTLPRLIWAFSWIHLEGRLLECVQVEGSAKRTLVSRDPESVVTFLDAVYDDQQHVVFVDGFTADHNQHTHVEDICKFWLQGNYGKRRLVFICSMSKRGKSNEVVNARLNCQAFFLESWTKEQYIEAVKDDEFYNNVKLSLDATEAGEGISREELVESKFYFGGGSCRYMFQFSTQMVTNSICTVLECVTDVLPYIDDTRGVGSSDVAACLFSSYKNSRSDRKRYSIVSRFAATQVALKWGPQLVDRLSQCLRQHWNPAMDGWLFEMRFFAKIHHEGVTVHVKDSVPETWPSSEVYLVDTSNIQGVPDDALWWKPQKWNEAGYDAVFINKSERKLQFVQLRTASKHSFKIEQFHKLVTQVSEHMKIKVLEIFFLSPKDVKPEISEVSEAGLLDAFIGWEKYTEMEIVKKGRLIFSSE